MSRKLQTTQDCETICAFFDTASAAEVERKYGKPDVIVASSVFTHLEDPHQFIEATKSLLADDGRFIIEVEYIGNIVRQTQFERFYLDRIFYYSLTSLYHLFKSHGMSIVDVEHIEPHGGSLRVTFSMNAAPQNRRRMSRTLLREEEDTLTLAKLEDFKHEVDKQIGAFRKLLEDYKKTESQGRWLWCAGTGFHNLQLWRDRPVADRVHGRRQPVEAKQIHARNAHSDRSEIALGHAPSRYSRCFRLRVFGRYS